MSGRAVRESLSQFFAACDNPAVVAVYLFGSVARGTDGPRSDLDVGVLYRITPPSRLDAGPFDLEADLERHLHRQVQVIVLNTAPPDLVHRVLRDGILVLDRDRSARIAFEVRARNDYFDLEPVRRAYRGPRRGASAPP